MPAGNSYPAPVLPLSGAEQLTLFQQQNGQVVTTTASVADVLAEAFNVQYVIPTFGTVARTLKDLTGPTYNLKSLGALLDGSVADEARIQAGYAAVPNNGTVQVPVGNWPASWSLTPNVNKSVFWNLLGTLDLGSATAGTAPVGYIGDGDVVAGYNAFNPQSYGFGKQIINTGGTGGDSTSRSVVDMNFINNNPNNYVYDVFSTLTVNSTSTANASGFLWGIQSNVYSYNNGNVGGGSQGVQNVAIAANVLRQPGSNNANWAFFGQISDNNGLPPSAFGGQLIELDYFTVGYDYTGGTNASYYDPANGGRQFIYLRVAQCANGPYNFGTWAANTNYTINTPIYPLTPSGYVYICTVAGRSAGTQPTWPTTIGQTVTDGGVTWKCSIANISEVSRGIEFTTDQNCNFGAGIIFGGNYTDAFIDCTYGNFLYQGGNNPCAIRLRAGMVIDFGAQQANAASQNQFTLGLSGSGQGFEYIVSGNIVFQCENSTNIFNAPYGLTTAGALYATYYTVPFLNTFPASGATITFNYAQADLRIGSGALAALTLVFGVPPYTGGKYYLKFYNAVAALTIQVPSGWQTEGAPSSIPSGGQGFELIVDTTYSVIWF